MLAKFLPQTHSLQLTCQQFFFNIKSAHSFNYQYGGLNPAKFDASELSPVSSFFRWPVSCVELVRNDLEG